MWCIAVRRKGGGPCGTITILCRAPELQPFFSWANTDPHRPFSYCLRALDLQRCQYPLAQNPRHLPHSFVQINLSNFAGYFYRFSTLVSVAKIGKLINGGLCQAAENSLRESVRTAIDEARSVRAQLESCRKTLKLNEALCTDVGKRLWRSPAAERRRERGLTGHPFGTGIVLGCFSSMLTPHSERLLAPETVQTPETWIRTPIQ